MRDEDLPDFFLASDGEAILAEARYLRMLWIRLVLLVVAAGGAAAPEHREHVRIFAAGSACAFLLAALLEIWLRTRKPEQDWYGARAAAESTKTLAWRYAVGGDPFPRTLPAVEARALFLARLAELVEDIRKSGLSVPPTTGSQLTERMIALREGTLEERRRDYARGRIKNQQNWYTDKARYNKDRANRWSISILLIEAAGGTAAVLRAAGILDIDLLAVAAALVISATAWTQARKFDSLAAAYSLTAHELSIIVELAESSAGERQWASFVNEAEEAISREHTTWRASHV